jgi:hypothetical protein
MFAHVFPKKPLRNIFDSNFFITQKIDYLSWTVEEQIEMIVRS